MNLPKIIYYKILSKLITRKNVDYKRKKFEDRNVLERIIFPYALAHFKLKTVLDIGREDYQKFYNEFFKNKELWTMDVNSKRKEFGANNHITDNVSNLEKHFKKNYFDFILMNGVFGWGLNKKEDIEKTFASIHKILKPGGLFILGWNDVEDLTPVLLKNIEALKKFKPFIFPPLKTEQFKCETGEHTYNFYTK